MPRLLNSPERAQRIADRRIDEAMEHAAVPARRALEAIAAGEDPAPAWNEWQATLWRGWVLIGLLGSAAVYGPLVRSGVVPPAENPAPRAQFAADAQGLWSVPFLEAARGFAPLVPNLREAIDRLGRAADVVTSRARTAAETAATDAIRRLLARTAPGPGEPLTPQRIAEAVTLETVAARVSARYDTLMRTGLQTAYTHGARRQLDQHRDVLPIRRLVEVRDLRTRGNPRGYYPHPHKHWQVGGFTAASDDPIWSRIWPPNGYNCRASVVGVTATEARQHGWVRADGTIDRAALERENRERRRIIDAGLYPDPGYRESASRTLGISLTAA